MKILGLKLSHDAAVAGIENGRLRFCVEIEKLDNRPRYTKMTDLKLISRICDEFSFTPNVAVIDGWKHERIKELGLPVASYHEFDSAAGLLARREFTSEDGAYVSYSHVAGHIIGTYATSPFAATRDPAYVVTWDGGQNPRVHLVNPNDPRPVSFIGVVHELYGIIYGIMGYYFGPYRNAEAQATPLDKIASQAFYGGYDKPGKLMSWIALGEPNARLAATMHMIYGGLVAQLPPRLGYHQDGILEHSFMRAVRDEVMQQPDFGDLSDADVLATVHIFLQQQLIAGVRQLVPRGSNLCFTGGSALNIKWNSALRRTGHFAEVWVPPFPNDSGSALGAAACEAALEHGQWSLDWDVYAGPRMMPGEEPPEGWLARPVEVREIAQLLHRLPTQPIIALNGRAEIGPRALGNRSILCAATVAGNKTMLNDIKAREQFRPVAPICIESRAPQLFDPGTPDPYMLFDHVVRPEWRERIPAVVHIDRTARLQTVNAGQNSLIHNLLVEYEIISGVPLLCNTSANLNGSGFFPDVASAARWGRVNRIWSNGLLYEKVNP